MARHPNKSLIRLTALGVVAIGLIGCSIGNWPPMRGGGMAEIAPASRSHLVVAAHDTGKAQLFTQVVQSESFLDELIERGAFRYMPGDTTIAMKLAGRIRREISGDLLSEAETDLIELIDRLSVIDQRLNDIDVRISDIATMT